MSGAATVRDRALAALRAPGAPRVMTPGSLWTWLRTTPDAAMRPRSVFNALTAWQRTGMVRRVGGGLYLNQLARPMPHLAEAAPWLRAGAVVSLQHVLGEAGVLNNPTAWITCVVPLSRSRAVGTVTTEAGVFQFSGVRDGIVPEGGESWAAEAFQPHAHVPTATPEKALLDWLYLAQVSPKWALPPRGDLDLDDLDADRLQRLARPMGLEAVWTRFQRSGPDGVPTRAAGGPRRR